MTVFELYKTIFLLYDHEYDLSHDDDLGNVLSDMSPFTFEGETSADECIYNEFKNKFEKKYSKQCTTNEGYNFMKEYISSNNVLSKYSFTLDNFINTYNIIK